MLNKVQLQGRIPDFKNQESLTFRGEGDLLKCEGKLSCQRNYKNKNEQYPKSDIIEFEAWGKLAQTIRERVTKGQQIIIEGNLFMTDNFEKDGKTVYGRLKVKAEAIHFTSAPEGGNSASSQSQGQGAAVFSGISPAAPQNNPFNPAPTGNSFPPLGTATQNTNAFSFPALK